MVTIGAKQLNVSAKLGTVDLAIEDYEITDELSQLSKFKIVVANSYDNRSKISSGISNTLYLYRDGAQFFKGKIDVDKLTYDRSRITIEGYDYNVILTEQYYQRNQGQYDYRRVQFDNVAANTILDYVRIDANTAYTAAYTVAECPATVISLRGEYENHLKWIAEIAHAAKWTGGDGKKHNCEWYIDGSDGIHIVQQRGSAKGSIPSLEVDTNERAYNMIGNAGYGFGYGDGINQLKSAKTNAGSISLYRKREFPKIDRRYQVQANLDDEMQRLVDENGAPVDSFKAAMPAFDWWENSISVGDTVAVADSALDIASGTYRIMKATVKPTTVELEVSNKFESIPQVIRDLAEGRRVDAGYMQGATNIYQFNFLDNFENAKPAYMYAYIPAKAKIINDVRLGYKLSQFRADNTVNASGGSTPTSAGSGGHNHLFGVKDKTYNPTYDRHILAAGPAADVNIYSDITQNDTKPYGAAADHTHTVDTAHTHATSYGVIEAAVTLPTVTININGTNRFTGLSGDQADLDITLWMQTGWNTIIFTPSSVATPNGLGRIQVNGFVQCFIESK